MLVLHVIFLISIAAPHTAPFGDRRSKFIADAAPSLHGQRFRHSRRSSFCKPVSNISCHGLRISFKKAVAHLGSNAIQTIHHLFSFLQSNNMLAALPCLAALIGSTTAIISYNATLHTDVGCKSGGMLKSLFNG